MKKAEALNKAGEKSKLIIEYITQILKDEEKVKGNMSFGSNKIDGQMMATLDIYVPKRDFEKHLNLGITSDHIDVLYEQFLNDLLDEILPTDTIGVTKFYSMRSMVKSFDGINAVNLIGSEITINMYGIDENIVKNYEEKYDRIAEVIRSNEQNNRKSR